MWQVLHISSVLFHYFLLFPANECPIEDCAPGYVLVYINSATSVSGSDIPPPRSRHTYSRYGARNGGGTKGGYSKGGYSKGGYSGSKGGYGYGKFFLWYSFQDEQIVRLTVSDTSSIIAVGPIKAL